MTHLSLSFSTRGTSIIPLSPFTFIPSLWLILGSSHLSPGLLNIGSVIYPSIAIVVLSLQLDLRGQTTTTTTTVSHPRPCKPHCVISVHTMDFYLVPRGEDRNYTGFLTKTIVYIGGLMLFIACSSYRARYGEALI